MRLINIFLVIFISLIFILVRSAETFDAEAEANDFADEAYESELLLAVRNGDLARVEDLLKVEGAFVDDTGDTTFTPLMIAAQKGDIDASNILLNYGADFNAREGDGWTPLMFAAYNGHYEVADELLHRGADSLAQNEQGDFAHLLAESQGHKELSIYIAEFGVTMSMLGDDTETLLSMIRHGANVNVENENGWTALTFLSARTSDAAAVKELIDLGANVNKIEAEGWTPLIFAAGNGREDIVRELLNAGADKTIADAKGTTARTEALAYASTDAEVSKRIVDLIDGKYIPSTKGGGAQHASGGDATAADGGKKADKKKVFGFF